MSTASFARRCWNAFTGITTQETASRSLTTGRQVAGYGFGQRCWAAFVGLDLPALPMSALAQPAVLTSVSGRSHQARSNSVQPTPPRSAGGWLPLWPQVASSSLRADDGDGLMAEFRSPDGRIDYFIRRLSVSQERYRLEVVVRDAESLPAVISVRSTQTKDGRVLLVPVVRSEWGPSAAQIDLVGFDSAAWEASGLALVDQAMVWDTSVVVASVGAAANEATRNAWRRVGEIVTEDMRRVITEALQ